MYEAELLGGPLNGSHYVVAYSRMVSELRFLETPRGSWTLAKKPKTATIVYKRFLGNLYIFDRRVVDEDISGDTDLQ